MAMAVSNAFYCPKLQFNRKNYVNRVLVPCSSPSSFVRFSATVPWRGRVTCSAASAAGSSNSDSDFNPYEVLGVSPILGFDKIKVTYTRKLREAERSGDEATASRLVKAYDKLMMAQLKNRKDGLTYGSLKVSKDIKYADKQPIVPWGPRSSKSSLQDTRINMAITAVFIAWVFIQQNAEYKPLQFLTFVFVYRIFEKLKSSEPTISPTITEDGEDAGRGTRMGKRLLRSLFLAFGCVAFASLGYTGIVNLMEYLAGFVPTILYNNQELLVTISSAISLYIIATYYR